MRHAPVTPNGDLIRWVELPGDGPARVYLHGLGSSSPVYFAAAAAHPLLTGRRSLLLDLLGFGISDRPTDFAYTAEAHADAVAAALEAAGVTGAEVVGHSMGGSIAVVLAARHPHLVSRLLLVDATLDPAPPTERGSGRSTITAFTEEEFLAGGREQVRDRVGPSWWATMRLAGPEALYRSALHLAHRAAPTVRDLLLELTVPVTYLHPDAAVVAGAEQLRAAGIEVVPVADCGHNIMLDNPEGFARAAAEALGAVVR